LIINDGVKRFLYLFFALIINIIYSLMGKGDKKSRRGKIHIGSTGVRRQPKKKAVKAALPVVKAEEPVKKPKSKATEKPKPEVEATEAIIAAAEETKPAAKKKAPAKASTKKPKSDEKPAEQAE
jgi:ribosomal small subunit protein bTHX